MDETTVFNFLLDLARTSKDLEGVVAACLVRADVVLEASASSDDGHYHAEYLVIQRAAARGVTVDGGLRHVVFAASDPERSATARVRFDQAGGTYRQVEDPRIIHRAVRLFNKTLGRDLSSLRLPRRTTL